METERRYDGIRYFLLTSKLQSTNYKTVPFFFFKGDGFDYPNSYPVGVEWREWEEIFEIFVVWFIFLWRGEKGSDLVLFQYWRDLDERE